MRYRVLEEEISYTGKELRSGWVRAQIGVEGDAAAGFIGPCHVRNEDLVDMDDARAGTYIKSESMAHVIAEHLQCCLESAVLFQRLLVCLLCEILRESGHDVTRRGDDVYCGDRKLTVSIAAPGPSSMLIHLGINIRPTGAPVPAIGLEEMGVDAVGLVSELLDRYTREVESARYATKKVRSVP
ncbi:MAG: DUF366 family protein [Candidatus Latescibacterota bacterium]|nr:MAG: DUF366 family protein [Candidatus Latescibacterota bacterium]